MTDEERQELFYDQATEFCTACGVVLPGAEDDDEHSCPFEPCGSCDHEAQEHDPNDPNGKCLAEDCKCQAFESDDDTETHDVTKDGSDEGTDDEGVPSSLASVKK